VQYFGEGGGMDKLVEKLLDELQSFLGVYCALQREEERGLESRNPSISLVQLHSHKIISLFH
jgi:hypothetical protein